MKEMDDDVLWRSCLGLDCEGPHSEAEEFFVQEAGGEL